MLRSNNKRCNKIKEFHSPLKDLRGFLRYSSVVFVFFMLFSIASNSKAHEKNSNSTHQINHNQSHLTTPTYFTKSESPSLSSTAIFLAQSDMDVYDPFADYSEFDDNSDEEADLNFFRDGRLFTMGVTLGYQSFTDTMGTIFTPAPLFGVYLSYFFNLRFALQFNVNISNGNIDFLTLGQRITGSSTRTGFDISLKYYINTQNITRNVARFNPYFIGGLSHMILSSKVSSNTSVASDNGFGTILGGGIEIPMNRQGSMYLGIQGAYKFIHFKTVEGHEFTIQQGPTGIIPRGDLFHVNAIFGVNF